METGIKQLLFVRHGESEANKLRICAGLINAKLTALGEDQARQAGVKLTESGQKIDVIVSSPLSRAVETARIIAKQVGYPPGMIVVTELATERDRGDFEGKHMSLQDGLTDEQLVARGAESLVSLQQRAIKLEAFLEGRSKGTVLLVSHYQFGKVLIAHRRQVTMADVEHIPNAQAMVI